MSGDVHSPTNAGPDLGPVSEPAATAAPGWSPPTDAAEPGSSPEALIGAAFAGGLAAAFILKRIFGGD